MAKTQAWDQIEALAQAYAQGRQASRPTTELLTVRTTMPPGATTSRQLEDKMLTNSRQVAATMLVQTRKSKGETAADQLADSYSSLPLIVEVKAGRLIGWGLKPNRTRARTVKMNPHS